MPLPTNFNPKNITLVEQDHVDAFEPEVTQVLTALGHPEALVTDLSQVADFMMLGIAEADPENQRVLADVAQVMGRTVGPREYLWQLGQELRERHETPPVS